MIRRIIILAKLAAAHVDLASRRSYLKNCACELAASKAACLIHDERTHSRVAVALGRYREAQDMEERAYCRIQKLRGML